MTWLLKAGPIEAKVRMGKMRLSTCLLGGLVGSELEVGLQRPLGLED